MILISQCKMASTVGDFVQTHMGSAEVSICYQMCSVYLLNFLAGFFNLDVINFNSTQLIWFNYKSLY